MCVCSGMPSVAGDPLHCNMAFARLIPSASFGQYVQLLLENMPGLMYVCTYLYIVLCRCVLHATSIERRIQQAQFQVENIATATAANKLPGCNPSWVAATKCRHR